ncbi:uncharacterized protein EAF01_003596 [Botrytis porri]|uniref:uncharacterized protein n=1 Tax=Botrytis porri TaxID=87229 RepID=UPI001900FE4A|nr:uncharacterized protein EAF01_003596 [Botrytis porri]KAF7909878.1 hypothetical protein EAF01_003596 [Botrytis porri]
MEMNGVRIMGCDRLWRKLVDKGSGIKKEGQSVINTLINYYNINFHECSYSFQFALQQTTPIYCVSNEPVLSCPVERDSRDKRQETRDKRRMPTQSINLKSSPVTLEKLRAVIQSMVDIDDNLLLSQSI